MEWGRERREGRAWGIAHEEKEGTGERGGRREREKDRSRCMLYWEQLVVT